MPASIVLLEGDALERANAVYRDLHFALSVAGQDQTWGVVENGAPVALGRVQHYRDGALEVGGFWVRDDRRGTGLGRRMVEHVVAQVPEGSEAWCLPFHHLVEFYLSFGMERVTETENAPESVRRKMDLCERSEAAGIYARTDVLILRR